jgi:hypothetical protein
MEVLAVERDEARWTVQSTEEEAAAEWTAKACHEAEGEGLQMKSRGGGRGSRDGQRMPELRVVLEALEAAKAFALTELDSAQQLISGAFSLRCLSRGHTMRPPISDPLVSCRPPCNAGLRADLMRQRERAHLL